MTDKSIPLASLRTGFTLLSADEALAQSAESPSLRRQKGDALRSLRRKLSLLAVMSTVAAIGAGHATGALTCPPADKGFLDPVTWTGAGVGNGEKRDKRRKQYRTTNSVRVHFTTTACR